MATLYAFHETKTRFIEATHYTRPLSYEAWNATDPDLKAAALFVQFYTPICNAWNKANAYDYIPDSEGVSIVLQYLQKNVVKLEEEPNKFTEKYIYQVAYNCMYCICHDVKRVKDAWEHEASAIICNSEGQEASVYDNTIDTDSCVESIIFDRAPEEEFWSIVEELPDKAKKVIRYLMTGDRETLRASRKDKQDPLHSTSVDLSEIEEQISVIREALSKSTLAQAYLGQLI